MGELRRMQFYTGTLGEDGTFVCDDGWTNPTRHSATGKPLNHRTPSGVQLAPGTRMIVGGNLSYQRGLTILNVHTVFVQEEL